MAITAKNTKTSLSSRSRGRSSSRSKSRRRSRSRRSRNKSRRRSRSRNSNSLNISSSTHYSNDHSSSSESMLAGVGNSSTGAIVLSIWEGGHFFKECRASVTSAPDHSSLPSVHFMYYSDFPAPFVPYRQLDHCLRASHPLHHLSQYLHRLYPYIYRLSRHPLYHHCMNCRCHPRTPVWRFPPGTFTAYLASPGRFSDIYVASTLSATCCCYIPDDVLPYSLTEMVLRRHASRVPATYSDLPVPSTLSVLVLNVPLASQVPPVVK